MPTCIPAICSSTTPAGWSRSISASWAGSALKERRFLAEILLGFITRDYRRVAEVHFEAGYVPPHHSVENFAQAIRAIGEPIHNRTAEEISMAKLLTLLLEVTGLFDMRTRPELILLQKTMVVVEGVARSFDPKLDIWKIADPVVREWIERNLGPIGRIQGAMSGAGDLGRVLAGLPTIAARVGRRAGAAGDHDPGRADAVAGDDRGDGPDRGPQEPLAHTRALDHRRDLYRHPVRRSAICDCNAIIYDSIAIIFLRRSPMASLTIRKLDEAIKTYLRLRSAQNGRSVEEEVRVILRQTIEGVPFDFAAAPSAAPPPARRPLPRSGAARRCGSGPRHADHRRRHRRLQVAGPDPAAQGAQHSRPLRADQGRAAIRHAAFGQRARRMSAVYTDLFDAESEFDAGHIRLARDCDLIVVAPATADLMAKMADGHADDLASAILLAANRPILLAPAMNPLMWNNAATRRNVAQLQRDGIVTIGPNAGEMAEAGEAGIGRMAEPLEIAAAAERLLRPPQPRPLAGKARPDHRRPHA